MQGIEDIHPWYPKYVHLWEQLPVEQQQRIVRNLAEGAADTGRQPTEENVRRVIAVTTGDLSADDAIAAIIAKHQKS